ncbi:hypothetical protein IAU60_005412 [Kwoniella sp. DSM 27419]
MPKAKFYAVRVGRRPGVYTTWSEAEKQVIGFPGAVHKSFPNYQAAKNTRGSLVLDEDLGKDDDLSQLDFTARKAKAAAERLVAADRVAQAKVKLEQDGSVETPSSRINDPLLSAQQEEILARVLAGDHYFFTGSAGTGKSVLLRAIIKAFQVREKEARDKEEEEWSRYLSGLGGSEALRDAPRSDAYDVKRWKLGVTASTGMAGVNIGGSTVHSWAGIGLGDLPAQKLYENILRNKVTTKRWRTTGALVIDEVSMIDGKLFDKLDFIARKIRRCDRPFGGLQLILSGDFFQLPPVARDNTCKFAFEADCWPAIIPRSNMSSLTRVFRQKEDKFVKILEGMRRGVIAQDDVALLKSLEREVKYPPGIEPVGLYPQKSEVARINDTRLAALITPLQQFDAFDLPGTTSAGHALDLAQATATLNRNTIWPEDLRLKVGALVMLIMDGVLVNGSTGIVVDFMTLSEASQHGIPPAAGSFGMIPDERVSWPVVEFVPSRFAAGKHAKRVLVPPMTVDVLNAMGQSEATRHQIPLILAWALTIHKSQGQTLDRVKIDLGKIFVEGQTYVAISRAVSLDHLEIRNFSADKVMAHSRVIEWARPFEQEQREEEEWDDLLANCDLDY